ncbi:hypothetical protein BUALT_Bualt03G0034100 [Buddleja alternifolia]|uniref:Uncharacterized protein n=1 Tax=Buddleja alternifolia TaxID=168488 RepID=A0AAV6XXL8_9LAMI|nr:hypothetical protein BUALT_Bualt03G0034100 [Buddleja alternifolia]
MPSGAKKRKAAKKKKGDHHSNPSSASTHSHGDENVNFKEGSEEQKGVEDNVVRVEREFEIEKKSDNKDGGSPRSSSGSSSSNSDDESQGIKNTKGLEEIASVLDSLKGTDSLSETPAEATHHEPIKEAGESVVKNIPASDSDKISSLVEKVEVDISSPADSSMAPLVESVIKENGKEKTSSVKDKVGTSVSLVDAASEREEETIVRSVEKNDTISDPKECAIQENDDKLTVSFNAPTTTTDDDGAERERVSGVTEVLHCWLRVQCKEHPGRVVVDCLKCFQGLVHKSRIIHELLGRIVLEEQWEGLNRRSQEVGNAFKFQ